MLFLLCLSLVVPAYAAQPQTQNVDDALATMNAFLKALGNADLDGVLATFSEGATAFLPTPNFANRLTGRKQIAEAMTRLLDNIRASGKGPPYMELTPVDVEVQSAGTDVAIITFHLGRETPMEDKRATLSRRTFVLERVKGKWVIVHLHASNLFLPEHPQSEPHP